MININNISKMFGNHIIFDNYSLSIKDNEMVAIVGESGCGKSTLLNIIGLLDTDYRGSIEIFGEEMTSINDIKKAKFIRNNINYLFQNYALVENETVEYNLLLALQYDKLKKQEKRKIILDALQKLNLVEKINSKVYTLSGGEQQRIAMARILLKPKKIILADEPTGNLDEKNRDIIIRLLIELHEEGHTIIIVTHDSEIASKCNKIIKI